MTRKVAYVIFHFCPLSPHLTNTQKHLFQNPVIMLCSPEHSSPNYILSNTSPPINCHPESNIFWKHSLQQNVLFLNIHNSGKYIKFSIMALCLLYFTQNFFKPIWLQNLSFFTIFTHITTHSKWQHGNPFLETLT